MSSFGSYKTVVDSQTRTGYFGDVSPFPDDDALASDMFVVDSLGLFSEASNPQISTFVFNNYAGSDPKMRASMTSIDWERV